MTVDSLARAMDLRGETRRPIEFAAAPPGALTWTPRREGEVPEDRIVRHAFLHILGSGHCTPADARSLGRAMGSQARTDAFATYLDAFSHLGLGELKLASATADRFVIEGRDLHEAKSARSLTCSLALGFVEGAVSAMTGHEAMGAEMECRSRGHTACAFHVRPKK